MSLQQRIIHLSLVLAGNTAFGALWLGAPERPAQAPTREVRRLSSIEFR